MKTAECVTPLHPDKICDRISDAILDACLEQDPDSRVAVETMGGHGIITITGEVTTRAYFNAREIAQKIAGDHYGVQVNIVSQSPEIANGVDTGGAGDQGIMVGYACNENEEMIPQELYLARSLCKFIYDKYPYDGKTQVTINEKGEIDTIIASFQNVKQRELMEIVFNWIKDRNVRKVLVNPAGDWKQGGFEADTGVTGRKLAVDNYGTRVPIGGGAFSGKDPSKVDRSGAYMARYIAVKVLKEMRAREVLVKIAYAIGIAEPVMITAEVDGKEMDITDSFDCTPKGIIKLLELKKPQYEKLAQWGHFGHDTIWK
jgi:S-adenosylmethionine synthetase